MSLFFPLNLLLIITVSFVVFGEGANDCTESRCAESYGPIIRFPFRLQHQPEHCGYPGFQLSCDEFDTILTLSDSVQVHVREIDYVSQQILLYTPRCDVNILHFNFSASPFHLNFELPLCNLSILNCSGKSYNSFPCSAKSDSGLVAVENTEPLDEYLLAGCKKIDEISSAPCIQNQDSLQIGWLNPQCGNCEGLGMDCGFKNYTKELRTQCFDKPSTTTGANNCTESKCNSFGPIIQFPFRLQHQPEHCGYPGFELFCYGTDTMLTLSASLKVSVKKIDYASQQIVLGYPSSCVVNVLQFNFSASPFHLNLFERPLCNFSIFNCLKRNSASSLLLPHVDFASLGCYDSGLIADIDSSDSGCKKIDEVSSVPCDLQSGDMPLGWSNPKCSYCEGLEKDCGFNNYTNELRTRCFDRPSNTKGGFKEPLIAGGVLSLFLSGIIVMALHECYSSSKTERENEARVEKFLEDYRALRPTRYTYAVIEKITNLFRERLGEGAYGIVYKGKVSNEIHVAVKVLNESKGNGEEFINEVAVMGKLHHVNVVRLVGFCADGFRRALVYEYLPNQSLDKLIFSASSINLNWKKLKDIALGIAHGLEYLHQRCDQQILHFDIKPQNILLDHNMNPKISDFGLAKLCSKEKSAVTMTEARGTMGYIAPEVLSSNFGKASHKSDVYSFGMLLLEMVGGRKNYDAKANTGQVNFPEWIHQQLNQGEELRIRIEEDDDVAIVKKLAIIGLWCIQWNATDRPSIKVVTQMLEGDGSDLTIPPLFTVRTTTHIGGGAIASRPRDVLTVISEE